MHAFPLIPFLFLGFSGWDPIKIDIDPVMAEFGPFTLAWHGFFTAVGIIAGVTLSVWIAKKDGIPSEIAQEIALVGVPCAIVGARLFYVAEHWDQFSDDIPSIVTGITEGGITLYGGLIGGVLGGLLYSAWRKWPLPIGLDAAAPGIILGQGIGRIGDLINGEHLADRTGLPWGVKYLHPESPQYQEFNDLRGVDGQLNPGDTFAVHPVAGGYELLGDFVICAILYFVCRRYLKAPGWVFASYMLMYGVLRFGLSFFRNDEQQLWDIPVPQLVSGLIIGAAIILAGVFLRWPGAITREYAERVWPDQDPDTTAGKPGTTANA
ncbi:MAG: prolipoprotein diacylglyceryl transferase [Dehalococcoidia bacterium]|nr:prolipoprotein diacylglyceryl transferase [Dehalococcoidia bacterium]